MQGDLELRPLSMFVSYARNDIVLRDEFIAGFFDQSMQECCRLWHDDRQRSGWNFDVEIRLHLDLADLILLLITPAFVASRYCMEVELPIARKRATEKGVSVIAIVLTETPSDERLAGIPLWPLSGRPLARGARGSPDHRSVMLEAKRQMAAQLKRKPEKLAYVHADYGVPGWSGQNSLQTIMGIAGGAGASVGSTFLWEGESWASLFGVVSACIAAWTVGVFVSQLIRLPEHLEGSGHIVYLAMADVAFSAAVSLVPGVIWGGLGGLLLALPVSISGWGATNLIFVGLAGAIFGGVAAASQAIEFNRKHLRLFRDINDTERGDPIPPHLDEGELVSPDEQAVDTEGTNWFEFDERDGATRNELVAAALPSQDAHDASIAAPPARANEPGAIGPVYAERLTPPERLRLAIVYGIGDESHVTHLRTALRAVGGLDIFAIDAMPIASSSDLMRLDMKLASTTLCVPLLTERFDGGDSGFLAERMAGASQNERPLVIPVLVGDVAGPQHKLQAAPMGGPIRRWPNQRAGWRRAALELREKSRFEYRSLLDRLHTSILWSGDDGKEADELDSSAKLQRYLERSRRAERSSLARFVVKQARSKRLAWSWRGLGTALLAGAVIAQAASGVSAALLAGAVVFGVAAGRREGKQFLKMFTRALDQTDLFDLLVNPGSLSGLGPLRSADKRYARRRMVAAAARGAAGWVLPLAALTSITLSSQTSSTVVGALAGFVGYACGSSRGPRALVPYRLPEIDDLTIRRERTSFRVKWMRRDGFARTITLSVMQFLRSLGEATIIVVVTSMIVPGFFASIAPTSLGTAIPFVGWAWLAVLTSKIIDLGLPKLPRNGLSLRFFVSVWIIGSLSRAAKWLMLPIITSGFVAIHLGATAWSMRLIVSCTAAASLTFLRLWGRLIDTTEFEDGDR